jgi:hypothetical protein
VAQVAATGALVRSAGGSRGAALAGMSWAAVASLPVLYAAEARAYALLLLLLTVAAWTFFRALGGGRPVDWALHAGALAAAWYTHNLALPFTGAFWIAAIVLRARRRDLVGLAAAHAAVVAAYSPWIPVLVAQSGSDTHAWIRLWWERTPVARLVPWSLELLGVAGPAPEYLDLPRVSPAARWASAALTAAAAIAAFAPPAPRERAPVPRRRLAAPRSRSSRWSRWRSCWRTPGSRRRSTWWAATTFPRPRRFRRCSGWGSRGSRPGRDARGRSP